MATALEREVCKLQFNIPKFEIRRGDNTEVRNKVLSLTPQDHKGLNINKSTLWYIQKHVMEGIKIKIYNKVMGKKSHSVE